MELLSTAHDLNEFLCSSVIRFDPDWISRCREHRSVTILGLIQLKPRSRIHILTGEKGGSRQNLKYKSVQSPQLESETYQLVQFSSVAQLCPTPRDPMDFSPQGSSVHAILQPRILEWVAKKWSWSLFCDLLHI